MKTQSSNTRFVVTLILLSVFLSAVAFSRNAFALTKLECTAAMSGRVVTSCVTTPPKGIGCAKTIADTRTERGD